MKVDTLAQLSTNLTTIEATEMLKLVNACILGDVVGGVPVASSCHEQVNGNHFVTFFVDLINAEHMQARKNFSTCLRVNVTELDPVPARQRTIDELFRRG